MVHFGFSCELLGRSPPSGPDSEGDVNSPSARYAGGRSGHADGEGFVRKVGFFQEVEQARLLKTKRRGKCIVRRLILRSFQSPGDVLMLTSAVRDLHAAAPGRFQTDVRTSCPPLWENNPHLTPLREGDPGVEILDMHYPLVHQSNQRPYHFIHGYPQYLEDKLGLAIPVTRFRGDIHLSAEEKDQPLLTKLGVPPRFWIVIAGGKYDFTAKWWNPDCFKKVVEHFQGRLTFVQCGEQGHWHPPLEGALNLVGKTTLREFVVLMHHAQGVLCPVTFAMHLAAAVDTPAGRPPLRPCVVVAGGREPPHWEAYPHHHFLHTMGALSCCAEGGCWRSRCQRVGDGDDKDRRDLCDNPVQISPDLRIARCMNLITPADVISRIDLYLHSQGGTVSQPAVPSKVRVAFHHGLGDCVYFAHLLPLYFRRGHAVEVVCSPDKAILFQAAGAATASSGQAPAHPWGYPAEHTHLGQGRFWQGSKMANNLSAPPLPNIGDRSRLWQEFCDTRLDVLSHLPAKAVDTAERWLARLPHPVILLHTKGNTGSGSKNLPDDVALGLYKTLLDGFEGSIILLDWDNRVPRLASYRLRHLDELGACPTEVLLALLARADLMIGVDSGPLHAARFSNIPTVGLWMPGHYPSTYSLPRRQQVNMVLADHTRQFNRTKRIPWNIVEHPGGRFDPAVVAGVCLRLLAPPRYLEPADIAADVQLQQWVGEFCRGGGNALSAHTDRSHSFDVLLREITRRFRAAVVVETGTIRAEEDWSGAGFFTYLMGAYLHRRAGRLDSVDISPANCAFAREWTGVFGNTVTVHQASSECFLAREKGPIDVLYLDSLDTTEPGHAEHALRELEAALPRLHERSVVVVDDSPWRAGAWTGKGARVIPWLLERGWVVGYSGYQAVLWKG
jgi:ADP-heptose:LPS heptosyltransferase